MADKTDEASKEKSFKLFWILDVQKTPCARESLLYGSVGSLVAGVGNFLATSRVRRSCDLAVGGFVLTTLGVWVYCRYNHAKLRIQQRMVQDGIKKQVMYEGSTMDPSLKNRQSDSDKP
ncbi:cytochrome c oxidase assembly protein COX20, mitochondrial [Rana temporaria]|uniref:cytochrome c oxidase assembly protein COX20, mitochondrial n=1 Tax=Rana temporaria TaxID=8407 RepID=UPI001AACB1BD|nr:cytochrome c oxidase assembly protein COX20, mitochondrial [Rana temporaria]